MTSPFGIEIGSAISSHEILEEAAGSKYYVSPPKPHPQFATYLVQASPTYGIVWIKGIGLEVENDGYGHGVRAAAERVAAQLTSKYGQSSTHDWTDPEGLWPDAKDWVMALLQGERSYFHVWNKSDQASLPDDIESVFIGIVASSSSSAGIVLEYSASNLEAAEAELDLALADLL